MASESDLPLKYSIRINVSAQQELDYIYQYTKEESYELLADRQRSSIISSIRKLDIFPNGYPIYEPVPVLRYLNVGKYRVFFKVNNEKREVEIAHIFHARRNIDNNLK